jgi:ABC-type phosphate/phosphonate transport system substrate-binding protein
MNALLAALPMYDWPEARASVDAEWQRLRERLRQAGIEAPESLTRRNAEMPAVPGGIRDGAGRVIAPDPATLPADELDFHTLWRHPALLLAQTCWGPMEHGLSAHVAVAGQPSYDGIEGGQGEYYSSAVLMRRGDGGESLPPADGGTVLPLNALRGRRLAYNGPDSMSGILALTRDLEAAGESLAIFADRLETGSHRGSIVAVAEGRADVCAIDCRSWQLARQYERRAQEVLAVGWTARRKGLPLITSLRTPPETLAKIRVSLAWA